MSSSISLKNYQWIASLYFFQSLPYVVVTLIASIMYQQYGVPNSETALLTSLFMLPWTIKPLFSPFLEKRATKKKLTLYAQASLSLLFMAMAFCVDAPCFLGISALGFFLLAFLSSLHDIVSDGVYIINLNQEEQKNMSPSAVSFIKWGG